MVSVEERLDGIRGVLFALREETVGALASLDQAAGMLEKTERERRQLMPEALRTYLLVKRNRLRELAAMDLKNLEAIGMVIEGDDDVEDLPPFIKSVLEGNA